MAGPKPAGSKKTKPSFDVARDPVAAEPRSGWVYRSDAQPVREPIIDVRPSEPRESREPREPRFEPAAPPPEGRSWLATGIYIMALPITLGMTMIFAPVSWILGARSRR